jgi:hypothetical protein
MIGIARKVFMKFLREFRWRPEMGDPDFLGWLTVAAYAVVTVLALRVWFGRRERIWGLVALGMLVLGVNKQFDFQSLFTDIGRVMSRHQGWYEYRRAFQKGFVLGMVGLAGVSGMWFAWRYRAFWLRHKLLAAGGLCMAAFIVTRAISFHHFDSLARFLGVNMNRSLELGGIFLIGLAAVREYSRKRT